MCLNFKRINPDKFSILSQQYLMVARNLLLCLENVAGIECRSASGYANSCKAKVFQKVTARSAFLIICATWQMRIIVIFPMRIL